MRLLDRVDERVTQVVFSSVGFQRKERIRNMSSNFVQGGGRMGIRGMGASSSNMQRVTSCGSRNVVQNGALQSALAQGKPL